MIYHSDACSNLSMDPFQTGEEDLHERTVSLAHFLRQSVGPLSKEIHRFAFKLEGFAIDLQHQGERVTPKALRFFFQKEREVETDLMALGRGLHLQGLFHHSATLFGLLTFTQEHGEEAWYNLAVSEHERGNYHLAVAAYQKAYALNPSEGSYPLYEAECHLLLEQHSLAHLKASQALTLLSVRSQKAERTQAEEILDHLVGT